MSGSADLDVPGAHSRRLPLRGSGHEHVSLSRVQHGRGTRPRGTTTNRSRRHGSPEPSCPILERLIGEVHTLVICRTRYTARLDSLVDARPCRRVPRPVRRRRPDLRHPVREPHPRDARSQSRRGDAGRVVREHVANRGAAPPLRRGDLDQPLPLGTHRGVRAAAHMGRSQLPQRPATGAIRADTPRSGTRPSGRARPRASATSAGHRRTTATSNSCRPRWPGS